MSYLVLSFTRHPTPNTRHPRLFRTETPGQCDRPVAERSDLVSFAQFGIFSCLSCPLSDTSANTRDGFPKPRSTHDAWWRWARRGRDILGGFPHPSRYAHQTTVAVGLWISCFFWTFFVSPSMVFILSFPIARSPKSVAHNLFYSGVNA